MNTTLKAALLSATLAAGATQANAQGRPPVGHLPFYSCGPTEAMEQTLRERYGEVARYGGTSSPIHLDRFWINEETGSWSNTRSNINSGVTCILTSGENGIKLEEPEPTGQGI